MKKWIGLVIVGALIGIFIWGILSNSEDKKTVVNDSVDEESGARQMTATDFELELLDGDTMRLSDTKGKITIINFWASWCDPCKMEAPHLQKFYEENKDRVEILGVNVTDQDTMKQIRGFVSAYDITFPVLLDETGDVSIMYGAFTIPTTIFLNADGEIVQQFVGPMDEDFLNEVVDSI